MRRGGRRTRRQLRQIMSLLGILATSERRTPLSVIRLSRRQREVKRESLQPPSNRQKLNDDSSMMPKRGSVW
jgi:hypothetical protein